MSFVKEYNKVVEKSSQKTGRHFAILLREDACMLTGIQSSALSDSELKSAFILHENEENSFFFGKFNDIFFKYGLKDTENNTSVYLALDFSEISTPITYILIDTAPTAIQYELDLSSKIEIKDKSIVYWETNQMTQLLIYSYDPLLKRMNCSIQTALSHFPKAFLRQSMWSILPNQIKQTVYENLVHSNEKEVN